MQTLRKKTSPLKYRNEPARFFGDGVVFKAKLIGILEVGEARGDRMCQEALQDLKIAIRAAGEHKQRITIHVTIEGLRLRDEKTGESLYHHPVHKISFIAQDMTDSRAFGYIFGSPDCGHRFFGIKTDKAASQVVLAMRDLFQCVFELKKKEIELAKQHIQNRITAHEHQQIKNSILEHKKTSSLLSEAKATPKPEKSPEATANLVDLEQELSSIQRGITQMERITPNDDAPTSITTKNVLDDDPFGDSFSANFNSTPFNILPPPAGLKSRNQSQQQKSNDEDSLNDLINPKASSSSPLPQQPSSTLDSWLHTSSNSSSIFKDGDSTTTKPDDGLSSKNTKSFDDSNNTNLTSTKSELIDAFTDLDPLGTGKSKPFVDKKYFFQDLKNPPKKVLKDLSDTIFDAHFSPQKRHVGKQGFSLDSSLSAGKTSQNETAKIIDPFDEEDFSKINIEQLESSTKSVSPNQKSIILPDTKIISSINDDKPKIDDSQGDYKSFSSDMPGDSWTSSNYSDLRRQGSDGSAKNVFSVDSFSKKLPKPNLFGQRNVKRDSNGINMRRLQESDSLSENEPELPPRLPDSIIHEPPPLPPKNQKDSSNEYSDKNRYTRTPTSRDSNSRYEYTNKFKSHSSDSPPIPLPSRKINRTETSISSKLSRKSNDEDDYLTPNPTHESFPQLPPPPPSKFRGPKKSDTDPKNLDAPTPPISAKSDFTSNPSSILPDITLSQLLTLGIDDLAQKLNVPASKLNTMTLVELTTYLSDFIEKSKHSTSIGPMNSSMNVETPTESPVFKVNFDDAVFEAKFDDNFGELQSQMTSQESTTFVANFDNFNQPPISVIPTADRYAVFREIIDQDIQQQHQYSFEDQHQESIESNNSNSLEEVQDSPFEFSHSGFNNQYESPLDSNFKQSPITTQTSKIDNKITEALSGAKDRYAALRELRNIVLVEDLFDKSPKPPLASISDSNLSDEIADDMSSFNQQIFETAEIADNNSLENVPTYSVSWADAEDNEGVTSENAIENPMQLDEQQQKSNALLTSNKDDLEIDEYMNKAISELSLDQRFSPNIQSKSPSKVDDENNTISKQSSPLPVDQRKLSPSLNEIIAAASPQNILQGTETIQNVADAEERKTPLELKAEKCVSRAKDEAEEAARVHDDIREKTITPSDVKPIESSESWAVFEQDEAKHSRPENIHGKHDHESGSSDGKRDWNKREKEYHKRWPKPHTSSSSREASPWDDDPGDQRKRSQMHHPPPHYHSTDRYARPPAPRRRMNSHEEDYDEDYERRRMRSAKPPIHRSKEVLENENWYHEQHWYPDKGDEEDERIERTPRPFDRNAYERSTYGPPYDKRDSRNYQGYDRRGYDKRSKYYRSYNRPEYEYEHPYDMPPGSRDYDDYEGSFERGARETRSAREYFYDRDRRSFDSNESYDSGRMYRMNSGEIYGSHESGRGGDYRYRDRYSSQGRMSRRNQRSRGTMEDDSDDIPPRRPSGDTGSLQRGQAVRSKHSNIKLDDEVWGSAGKGYWKRPGSATAGDRMSGSGGLSGSDGERDKRLRRKTRQGRSKEVELRSNYATIRYQGQEPRRKEYYDFDDDPNDETMPGASPRFQAMNSRDYYAKKKQHSTGNARTGTTPRMENKSFSEYVKPRYASPYDDDIGDENFDDENRAHGRNQNFKKSTSKDIFLDDTKEHLASSNNEMHSKKQINRRNEHAVEEQAPAQPNNNKFAFDGFESDFTTSPKQQNDQKNDSNKFTFEEREFSSVSPNAAKNGNSQQKLRFNENVSVSKFDKNASSQQMFEDDFLQSWTPETPSTGSGQIQSSLKKTSAKASAVFTRQDNIKKSDSVNIFARKSDEDPFANDDFFSGGDGTNGNEKIKEEEDPFQWNSKNNFANFDDNKNI